jgi:phosphonate transport system substrate-binding protein
MCLALALPALPAASQEKAPLVMGIHPYNSTLALVNTHRSLMQYLTKTLGRPVEFYTAPSFDGFTEALMAGRYDIVISPPHFAVLAIEKQYLPLAHYRMRLEPILVVRADSRFHKAADFRGARIAMADKTAFIRIVVVKWLADQGMIAGKDYQILERPTHSAAISAAIIGEADAGLATFTTLRQIPADVQQQVRGLGIGIRFPHLFTLANKRLGEAEIARIRAALLAFPDTPEGKDFMEKTSFLGYEEATPEEIQSLKPYVEMYKQMDSARP